MEIGISKEDKIRRLQELNAQHSELEMLIQDLRKRRHIGMDDDRAEDIVEEYYRDLLSVEREIEELKTNL